MLQYPLNKLTDQLREEMANAGFTEALTFSLVYFTQNKIYKLFVNISFINAYIFLLVFKRRYC